MVYCTPFSQMRKLKPNHSIVLRFIYKAQDGKLWAYNKPKLNYSYFSEIPSADGTGLLKNEYKETREKREADEDEENDVDLNRTMWLIIRKKRSPNQVLKDFFPDYQSQMVRVRDIVKFGRVNFKISELDCDRIDPQYNGTCYKPPNTTRLRNKTNEDTIGDDMLPTNANQKVNDNDRSMLDDRSIDNNPNLTEMNLAARPNVSGLGLLDNSSSQQAITQLNHENS